MVSVFASGPSCHGFDSHDSQNLIVGKIVDVAEKNIQRCLEESELWLENANQTHLVLARGKLLIQKATMVK